MSKHICMLAHLYDPKRVIFPAYIQPKLDGIRAIWKHKEKRFVSRNNKPLVLPIELIASVISAPFDIDGELVIFGETFNEISGIVRHQDMIPQKENITYIAFDTLSDKLFRSRFDGIIYLQHVRTTEIRDYEELNYYHQINLDLGYEGSIIRNNTPYEFKRSFNLLKLKPTKEIICKIIGFIEGTGKYEDMLGALTVETANAKIFNVGSGFTDEERNILWTQSPEKLYHLEIRIKYQDLSEYGIPRFPIFKGFIK